jgi:hypothetical protein
VGGVCRILDLEGVGTWFNKGAITIGSYLSIVGVKNNVFYKQYLIN